MSQAIRRSIGKGKTEVIFKPSKPKVILKKAKKNDKSMEVSGRLEVALKINDIPNAVTIEKGRKVFVVEADGYKVKIILKLKSWKKFEKAAKEYEAWVANISGKIKYEDEMFEIINPGLQIFEKKVKK